MAPLSKHFLLLSFPSQSHPTLTCLMKPSILSLALRLTPAPQRLVLELRSRFQILLVVGIWELLSFSDLISLYAASSITEYNFKQLRLLSNYSLRWCIGLRGEKLHAEFTAWSYDGESSSVYTMHLFIQEMFMEYLPYSWHCLRLAMNFKWVPLRLGKRKKKPTATTHWSLYDTSNDKKHYEENQRRVKGDRGTGARGRGEVAIL